MDLQSYPISERLSGSQRDGCVWFVQGLQSHLSKVCESYSDSPHQHGEEICLISEKYASMSTLEHVFFFKVTPHEVTLKVTPHTAAPVRNQKALVLHFTSITLCHVVMKLKSRKEPQQSHVFNSCHQYSVRLSKTKNSPLSQIENLLAAKIH